MKLYTSLASVASLISLFPTVTALAVQATWSVTNVPASGLTDITFPITIVDTERTAGYYMAENFGFVGADTSGYTGLQPRPDQGGKQVLHAAFSSFIDGTTTTDPNCSDGADGGPGVSCSVEWNGVYGRTYDLEVKYAGGQLWVGTAIDTVTQERTHIGSYKVPAGVKGIASNYEGIPFVEYYYWNDGKPQHDCASLPYQKSIFGIPRTSHGGSVGSLELFAEYGDCAGKVAFHTERVASGVEVNCGFKGPALSGLVVQANTY